MRRVLIAVAAGLLWSSAWAADEGLEPSSELLDGSSLGRHSWTGPYVGLFGGFGIADVDVTDVDGFNGDPGHSFDYRVDGFYGGGLAGYNYEWSLLVLGAEAELAFIDLEDGEQDPAAAGLLAEAGNSRATFDSRFYAAVTGRVGLSIDRFLGYAKGGLAFAEGEASFKADSFEEAASDVESGAEWLSGWTVGGGVEMAVNPSFSLRAEYTFTEFGEGLETTGTDALGESFEFEHDLENLHLGKFAATYRF